MALTSAIFFSFLVFTFQPTNGTIQDCGHQKKSPPLRLSEREMNVGNYIRNEKGNAMLSKCRQLPTCIKQSTLMQHTHAEVHLNMSAYIILNITYTRILVNSSIEYSLYDFLFDIKY